MKKLFLLLSALLFGSSVWATDFFSVVASDKHVASGGTVTHVGTDSLGYAYSGATTITLSHTVPTGADFLKVDVKWWHWGTTPTISSVTYNGTTMTSAGSAVSNGASPPEYIQSFYLVAPTVTTANVVVTFTTDAYGRAVAALNYSGVNQVTPIEGYATGTGSSVITPLVPTTTTVNGTMLVGACSLYEGAPAFTTFTSDGNNRVTLIFAAYPASQFYGLTSDKAVTGSGATLNYSVNTGFEAQWQGYVYVLKN